MENANLNIIRIVPRFYPEIGGSITHAIHLSEHINPYLASQILIAPHYSDNETLFDSNFKIPVIRVNAPWWLKKLSIFNLPYVPIFAFIYMLNVIRVLKRLNVSQSKTVIYIHGIFYGAILLFLARLINLEIPIVTLIDSSNPFDISNKTALLSRLSIIIFRRFKLPMLIIVDDGMRIREFIRICEQNGIKYSVVSHAIEAPIPTTQTQRSQHSKYIILSTQRLDPFKRVDLAIKAFSILKQTKNVNAKLVLLGDGPEYKNLRSLAIALNMLEHIRFLGRIPHSKVSKYLKKAHIVIGTSLKSNLNLSIQEAMAYGKPVVVFNSGRTRQLVSHLKTGILVTPNNIYEFAEKLYFLIENPKMRIKLGKTARNFIIKRRSWEIRIKKELHILNSVITRSN